ncbi:hypothetical protein [Streptomyces sp. NPDC052701]|uniref:hypothetical protein n=1 Tax=Streptomyces sp. NPDC052701 TaxID=3155533 RepID=UPI003427D447
MSEPSENPDPSYTRIHLSGPPEAVARLIAALGAAGEIIFDHRSAPDARGDVVCTAQVVTYDGPQPVMVSGKAEAVVQSVLGIDAGRWPGLAGQAAAHELEESAAAALAGLEGVHEARSRLVAVAPTPAGAG